MSAAKFLGVLGVVLSAMALVVASRLARRRRWTSRGLSVATGFAVAILAAVVISDWPTDWLNEFWASHSVLAAVGTTALLAAVAFLAFEARETAKQEELSRKVSVAGLSGLVDRLIDVDLALFMIQQGNAVAGYTRDGRPLQWLSTTREELQAAAAQWNGRRDDPELTHALSDEDRAELLGQCVRRTVGGMRDWASLVGTSADGREALVSLGEVRIALLEVSGTLRREEHEELEHQLNALRRRVQLLAFIFEKVSSGPLQRPGVLVRKSKTEQPDAAVDDQVLAQVEDIGSGLGSLLQIARHESQM